MKAFFQRLKDEISGATAIEYGLILALLFIAMVGAVNGFADENFNIWTNVSNAMSDAVDVGTAS
jgi:pilus assembly protein Flp/PilA